MNKNRKGFTIIEMMMVVAVMAIIASLATGAAFKSIKSSRRRRVQATKVALQTAIENFHAQENQWPFELSQLYHSKHKPGLYWAYVKSHRYINVDNTVVFEEMLDSNAPFLDSSALLGLAAGARKVIRNALKEGCSPSDIILGYPNPNDTSEFCFFAVRYNSDTDSVNVYDKSEIDAMSSNEF